MAPDDYCARKAAPAGSDLYYALLFLPAAERGALTALHAFRAELTEVVEQCTDPGVARLKLQWWREESARSLRGEAQQPVARALQQIGARHTLAFAALEAVVDAVEGELDEPPARGLERLIGRRRDAGSALWRLCAAVSGVRSQAALDSAAALGAAQAEAAALRNLRVLLRRPGAAAGEVQIAARIAAARRELAAVREAVPREDRLALLAGITLTRLEGAALAEVERDGCRVLEHRIALTPLRKLWIAWRCQRAERRRAR